MNTQNILSDNGRIEMKHAHFVLKHFCFINTPQINIVYKSTMIRESLVSLSISSRFLSIASYIHNNIVLRSSKEKFSVYTEIYFEFSNFISVTLTCYLLG